MGGGGGEGGSRGEGRRHRDRDRQTDIETDRETERQRERTKSKPNLNVARVTCARVPCASTSALLGSQLLGARVLLRQPPSLKKQKTKQVEESSARPVLGAWRRGGGDVAIWAGRAVPTWRERGRRGGGRPTWRGCGGGIHFDISTRFFTCKNAHARQVAKPLLISDWMPQ